MNEKEKIQLILTLNGYNPALTGKVLSELMSLFASLLQSEMEGILDTIKKHSANLPIEIERKSGLYAQGMHAGLDLAIDDILAKLNEKVEEIKNIK